MKKQEEDVKNIIKSELNSNLEFDGETLEKIIELGIKALGKNSSYSSLLKQKQLTEQTLYKINDKSELQEISNKLDSINLQQIPQTLQKTTTNLNFKTLYDEFVEKKKAENEVQIKSYNGYRSTFHFFQDFFQDKDLNTLNYKDQNALKSYMQVTKVKTRLLAKRSLNNHIQRLKSFFIFGENTELLNKNFLKNIKPFNTKNDTTIIKENYSDEQLLKILTTDKNKFYSFNKQRKPTFNYHNLFKICIFSGTRISEILKLKKENVKADRFIIKDAKTSNGNRTIPIHFFLKKQDFIELIDNLNIVYKNEIEEEAVINYHTKNANKILKKLDIDLKEKQTFHTIRGTFMEKLINKDITKKVLVQMMVGHSIPEEDRLTLQTYVKKIDFELYKDLMGQFELK